MSECKWCGIELFGPFPNSWHMPVKHGEVMMLMFHDDDCGELLDWYGRCPKCDFHPDGQSTSFRDVPDDEVQRMTKEGRAFLGRQRRAVQ